MVESKVTSRIMLITKDVANEMLRHNNNNYRKIKWDIVNKYARMLEKGLWRLNGEPIVFDEDGVLKNGQHRLTAVVKTNIPIEAVVVCGVDRDINTWDEGSNRSTTDKARAENLMLSASTIGAAGLLLSRFNGHEKISNDEKLQYCWEHVENFKKAQVFCSHGKSNPIMKKSACIASVFCAIEMKVMPDSDLDAFCTIVNSGMPNEKFVSDSAIMLRNSIIEGIKDNAGCFFKGRMANKPLFEITWQAMKAFVEGRKMRRKFTPNGHMDDIIENLEEMQKTKIA